MSERKEDKIFRPMTVCCTVLLSTRKKKKKKEKHVTRSAARNKREDINE